MRRHDGHDSGLVAAEDEAKFDGSPQNCPGSAADPSAVSPPFGQSSSRAYRQKGASLVRGVARSRFAGFCPAFGADSWVRRGITFPGKYRLLPY